MAIVALTLVASVLVARAIGPGGRGQYATLMSVFAIAMALGEFGQSAAVTFYVARDNSAAASVITSSRRIMLAASLASAVGMGAVVVAIPTASAALKIAYCIALVSCIANAIGAPYLYATQAVDIRRWNTLRLAQPCLYTGLIATVVALSNDNDFGLMALATCLTASTIFALAIAAASWRSRPSTGRSTVPKEDLRSYGAASAISGVPIAVAGNLDKVILVPLVSAEDIGQYAVALSVATLALPIATALASVSFPRISAMSSAFEQAEAAKKLVLRSGLALLPATLLAIGVGMALVPLAFGAEFRQAATIALWLAPAAYLRATNVVTTAALRGLGMPGAAASAQLSGLVLFLTVLVPLAQLHSLAGVAVSLAAGELLTVGLGCRSIRTARRRSMT